MVIHGVVCHDARMHCWPCHVQELSTHAWSMCPSTCIGTTSLGIVPKNPTKIDKNVRAVSLDWRQLFPARSGANSIDSRRPALTAWCWFCVNGPGETLQTPWSFGKDMQHNNDIFSPQRIHSEPLVELCWTIAPVSRCSHLVHPAFHCPGLRGSRNSWEGWTESARVLQKAVDLCWFHTIRLATSV